MGVFNKKVKAIEETAEEVAVEEVVAQEVKETPTPAKAPATGTSWFTSK
jgi:hypothetical protein